jgi:hypothetical protein
MSVVGDVEADEQVVLDHGYRICATGSVA